MPSNQEIELHCLLQWLYFEQFTERF